MEDVKSHSWFNKVDWEAVQGQQITPPYIPPHPKGPDDTSYFDTYPDSLLDPSHPLRAKDRESFMELGKAMSSSLSEAFMRIMSMGSSTKDLVIEENSTNKTK